VIGGQSAFQSSFPEKVYVNIKRTEINLKKDLFHRKNFSMKNKKHI